MAIGLFPRGKRPDASSSVGLTLPGKEQAGKSRKRRKVREFILDHLQQGEATPNEIASASHGQFDTHRVKRELARMAQQGLVRWDALDSEEVEWQ